MPLIIFKAQYNLYVSWSGWTTSRAKWWRAACSRVGWEAPGALQPRRALLERPLPAETSEASLNKLTTIISLLDHGSVDYGASTIAHFVAQKLGLSAFVPLLCHALRSYSMWTNLATLNFVVHKLEGLILPVSKHSKQRHRSVMIIMRLLNVIFLCASIRRCQAATELLCMSHNVFFSSQRIIWRIPITCSLETSINMFWKKYFI